MSNLIYMKLALPWSEEVSYFIPLDWRKLEHSFHLEQPEMEHQTVIII